MTRRNAQPEHVLQTEILYRLKAGRWPVIPLVTPNGLSVNPRSAEEARVIPYIIRRMKTEGMIIPGMPDLVLLAPGSIVVEIKRPRRRGLLGEIIPAGQPSDDQRAFAARAEGIGVHHLYTTDWPLLEQRLDQWLPRLG